MTMATAREVMSADVEFASPTQNVREAARKMDELDIGMLPVCGPDKQLVGTITDRDLALKVVGRGLDPQSTTVEQVFTQGEVVTIGADDSLEEAADTMERHAVRRLPVIDGDQVVGILSQADVAMKGDSKQAGEAVKGISEAPPD
jgi:CBS domain-containing protein